MWMTLLFWIAAGLAALIIAAMAAALWLEFAEKRAALKNYPGDIDALMRIVMERDENNDDSDDGPLLPVA